MGITRVKDFLRQWNKDTAVQEFAVSSATVDLAAEALGVIPARIAKSIAFAIKAPDGAPACAIIVAAGDCKIKGGKFKAQFGCKAAMLSPEETLRWTGFAVGGVCPFAVENAGVSIWLDVSLKRFDTVFPACGSSNSAIELSCDELARISGAAGWVDVCSGWESGEGYAG